MSADETCELFDAPAFCPGDKVRALKAVRNDGTFPGMATGTPLIDAGDIGYVRDVGTFLQRYFIYAVDFFDKGRIVGMRRTELERICAAREKDEP